MNKEFKAKKSSPGRRKEMRHSPQTKEPWPFRSHVPERENEERESRRRKGTRSCRIFDRIIFAYLKSQVLVTPLLSTDSSQKPITQNLYHSITLSPYYTASFLNFRNLKILLLII